MDVVGDSLRKVVKGTAIFLLGSFIGLFIALLGKILVIRYITPDQFGLLSLSVTIYSIIITFASLGLPNGITRQAAYFLGKNEHDKVRAIFIAGVFVSAIFGILAAIGLFVLADVVADFFNMQNLSWILRMLSFVVPLGILSRILTSIFQVYENVSVKVVFNDIMPNVLRVGLVVSIILLSLSFYWIVVAYFLSFMVSGVFFLIYFFKNVDLKTSESMSKYLKILILFSLPLLFQSVLGMIINWTDTLMIGYFLTSSDVGLYNGAQPLAKLMINFLVAINFLYFPIVSQLYAKNQIREVGRIYAVVTKWLMSISLPIFLVLFLFPSATLWLLYGSRYLPSAYALRILALGFFVHLLLGPNGMTLIATGNVRFLTIASFAAATVNFILNLVLIPSYGITGAAIASASTYVTVNTLISSKLYKNYGIHPFTRNYIKPMLVSLGVVALIYYISKALLNIGGWMLLILFVVFVTIYFFSLLVTRSFDKEDIAIMLAIEQRLGINLSWAKRILRKFI